MPMISAKVIHITPKHFPSVEQIDKGMRSSCAGITAAMACAISQGYRQEEFAQTQQPKNTNTSAESKKHYPIKRLKMFLNRFL